MGIKWGFLFSVSSSLPLPQLWPFCIHQLANFRIPFNLNAVAMKPIFYVAHVIQNAPTCHGKDLAL
jgi:hypothetical protein